MLKALKKKIAYAVAFQQKRLVHLNLQILYQCNFHCRICDFWKPPYTALPQLSLAQIRTIEKKLGALNPMIISIGGGEPLLHPDIVDICSILAANHFPVMISNGWLMSRKMAAAIWQAGLYEVSISLDYASAEKHDAMRGKQGAFERAVAALVNLKETRVFPHQRVHMIATVMEDNLEEMEPLIALARETGVTFLVSSYSQNRGAVGSGAKNKDYGAHLLELKKKYPEFVALHGYIARFTAAQNKAEGVGRCRAGINLFNIDSQGNVTFCIDRLEQKAGNIFDDDVIVLRDALYKQAEKNDCRLCWSSCRGSIETLMYGKSKLRSYYDLYQMTKKLPLCTS